MQTPAAARGMNEPKISPELLGHAERAFGNNGVARAWFYRPNLNLPGRWPLDSLEAGEEGTVTLVLDAAAPPAEEDDDAGA